MDFMEFTQTIKEMAEVRCKENDKVSLNRVPKNNGVVLQGLTISKKGRNISPTIYLEEFYKEYQKGRSAEDIVEEILFIYEEKTLQNSLDMDFFTEYDKAVENIVFKLVNYEKNEELLADVPHVKYLDLAIVFLYLFRDHEIGNATILIHNNHLKIWEKTTEDLYEAACKNTPRLLKWELKGMEEILKELCAGDHFYDEEEAETDEECPDIHDEGEMYVLTNHERINGAGVILYDSLLSRFAERKKKDIIILPSSVHEVILLPCDDNQDKRMLMDLVKEVNQTQVEAQEVLSDSVYLFSRKEQKVVCL